MDLDGPGRIQREGGYDLLVGTELVLKVHDLLVGERVGRHDAAKRALE